MKHFEWREIVAFVLHSIYAIDMSRLPKRPKDQVENRVEEFRIMASLSRQELADAVGVHYQTIGYIERGEYSPTRSSNALGHCAGLLNGAALFIKRGN